MGTWDIGPFDNDTAADFSYRVDEASDEGKAEVLRAVLREVAATADDDYLDADVSMEAIASAALIAAQCPGGAAVTTSYGPKKPLPILPSELRPLAVAALDRTLGKESELLELWEESDGEEWKAGVLGLRGVLAGA
ncbi:MULTISPECIES: DUF4259 domain-containing protein [unclassified Streptomyces]|uniref:DUF4259 domain-containing protein n=1 Tax=unclassified Streptomyces TaxID=2593676 RepID=UPI0016610BC3|nr:MULTISPECIES: DUF4259 domain-containing protein [unclassified Streptomyces]MBD0708900.1 hypothetical protein [Streptomyces sp. CBMA291]MBD0715999.1 hypothetical protein [Streptomyces sp. CBMA370]